MRFTFRISFITSKILAFGIGALKRTLASGISNPAIDEAYETAMANGALGGKLLGAGGGGFLLFYVPQERQENVKQAMSHLLHVPFRFENGGTEIVLYSPESFSPAEVTK